VRGGFYCGQSSVDRDGDAGDDLGGDDDEAAARKNETLRATPN